MSTTSQQTPMLLERVNYEATLPIAQVTPTLELVLRDDVIIISSKIFPSLDTNHACLLQATPQTADSLITEVIDYFNAKTLPPTIFVSPACTPADLPQRLLQYGFVENKEKEKWMVLDNLPKRKIPAPTSEVVVKQITRDEVLTFAKVFMTAFEMPLDFAPYMAQLVEPSVNLPGVYHYLGILDDQPVGTFSLFCYKKFGIIGSAGVIPARRGKRIASNLAAQAAQTALRQGVDTLMLQTSGGYLLVRLLRIWGFKTIFTRISYTLS